MDFCSNLSSSGGRPLLPDNLILDILSRLPLHALYRCNTVCKAWPALIPFAQSQRDRNKRSTSDFSILIVRRNTALVKDSRLLLLIEGHNQFQLKTNDYAPLHLDIYDSCNGFLLMVDPEYLGGLRVPHFVGNPFTSKYIALPPLTHKSRSFLFSMIVFDPQASPYYNVIVFVEFEGWAIFPGKERLPEMYVFSSKSGIWKTFQSTLKNAPIEVTILAKFTRETLCMNGYAYRTAIISPGYRHGNVISVLSFDVENEEIEYLGYPYKDNDIYPRKRFVYNTKLIVAQDCLVYVHADSINICMWRLNHDQTNNDSSRWSLWKSIDRIEMNRRLGELRSHLHIGSKDCIITFHGQHRTDGAIFFFAGEYLWCHRLDSRDTECVGNVGQMLSSNILNRSSLIPFSYGTHDPSWFDLILDQDL